MPWIEVIVQVPKSEAELCQTIFEAEGAHATTLEDGGDQPILESSFPENALWDQVRVIGLFEVKLEQDSLRNALLSQIPHVKNKTIEFRMVSDEDWERVWMDHFHPMPFGKRLWIVPSWLTAPHPEATNVIVDPGMAFGTGAHPTTAMCLRWLDQHLQSGQRVMDFGCGSGILTLAALKLGAKHCHAVDLDPQALYTTKTNALKNDISPDAFACHLPEELPKDIQVDVLLSNILASPLISLAHQFSTHLSAGQRLVLSGILTRQVETLIQHYAQWFTDFQTETESEWAMVTAKRKAV